MTTLKGKVALVAGATRGAGRGIAISLGEAGATVYCTGRSTRADSARRAAGKGAPFDLSKRPETIEETAELVEAHGGRAIAVRVDHLDEGQVKDLCLRIARDHGRIDVLVNDIWGGEELVEWGRPLWELSSDKGFAMVERVLRTHFTTSRFAVPMMLDAGGLVVEVTDGDFLGYRGNVFYDLAKIVPIRLASALVADLATSGTRTVTAVSLTPGFLRSEAMLDYFGVTEDSWRDAIAKDRHFAHSETPRFVGRAVVALASDPDVGKKSGRVLSSWGLAREYGFTDVDGSRPDWGATFDRTIAEILDRGGPKDEEERGLLSARYFQLALDPTREAETRRMAAILGLPQA